MKTLLVLFPLFFFSSNLLAATEQEKPRYEKFDIVMNSQYELCITEQGLIDCYSPSEDLMVQIPLMKRLSYWKNIDRFSQLPYQQALIETSVLGFQSLDSDQRSALQDTFTELDLTAIPLPGFAISTEGRKRFLIFGQVSWVDKKDQNGSLNFKASIELNVEDPLEVVLKEKAEKGFVEVESFSSFYTINTLAYSDPSLPAESDSLLIDQRERKTFNDKRKKLFGEKNLEKKTLAFLNQSILPLLAAELFVVSPLNMRNVAERQSQQLGDILEFLRSIPGMMEPEVSPTPKRKTPHDTKKPLFDHKGDYIGPTLQI